MDKPLSAAVALGKRGRGIPKNLTKAQRKFRKQQMAHALKSRWPVKENC